MSDSIDREQTRILRQALQERREEEGSMVVVVYMALGAAIGFGFLLGWIAHSIIW